MKTQSRFAAAGSVLGVLLRGFEQKFADFHLLSAQSDSGGGMGWSGMVSSNKRMQGTHITFIPDDRRNAEAREPELKHVWLCDARHPNRISTVARLSIPLAAKDQGSKCILLTVADRARARPRKTVTGEWPSLIDFCCFRHHLNANGGSYPSYGRKLRKSIKGRRPKL